MLIPSTIRYAVLRQASLSRRVNANSQHLDVAISGVGQAYQEG